MRVARVIAVLEPGGAQLGALRLSLALGAEGIESRWLAGHATREGLALFRASGVEVELLGGGPALQYARRRAFADRLTAALGGEEVVHAHMFGAWWAAARAARRGAAGGQRAHRPAVARPRTHPRATRGAHPRRPVLRSRARGPRGDPGSGPSARAHARRKLADLARRRDAHQGPAVAAHRVRGPPASREGARRAARRAREAGRSAGDVPARRRRDGAGAATASGEPGPRR